MHTKYVPQVQQPEGKQIYEKHLKDTQYLPQYNNKA